MTLIEHLEELRKTVFRVVIIVFLSFLVCYSFGDTISELLLAPLRESLRGGNAGDIVYLGVLDKVLSQFQVAFWSSILFSSPFWFYEVWRFIKPALYEREAKWIRPFIVMGFIFFWLGVSFGYFVVFPITFKTLLTFGVADVKATIGLKEYLVLVCKVLVALGLIFQLPNAMLVLGFMGLVTKYSLRNMRRYVYVILAILSALLTPPDVFTMMGLWVPLIILFEIGVLAVALIVHPIIEKPYENGEKSA